MNLYGFVRNRPLDFFDLDGQVVKGWEAVREIFIAAVKLLSPEESIDPPKPWELEHWSKRKPTQIIKKGGKFKQLTPAAITVAAFVLTLEEIALASEFDIDWLDWSHPIRDAKCSGITPTAPDCANWECTCPKGYAPDGTDIQDIKNKADPPRVKRFRRNSRPEVKCIDPDYDYLLKQWGLPSYFPNYSEVI